jgi:hypothetical protein
VFRLTRHELLPARVVPRPPVDDDPASADDPPVDDDPPVAAPDEPALELEAAASVLRGGAWIGYLERAAVAGTLLAGFPEGLALVLGLKGVGRYPELRDASSRRSADTAEEFIIGTLASLLWAAAAAGTAALLR